MNKTEEYQRTISRLAYLLAYLLAYIIFIITAIFADSFILRLLAALNIALVNIGSMKSLGLIIYIYMISYFCIPSAILSMTYDELGENYKILGEIVKEHKERKENKNQYRGKMVPYKNL